MQNFKLVLIFGPDYDNHLLTEEHRARSDPVASIQKKRCETCKEQVSEDMYENHSRSQCHNLVINNGNVQWNCVK